MADGGTPVSRQSVHVDAAKAWSPYDRQARFIRSNALFNLFLGGVGSGKSHALVRWLVRRALINGRATHLLGGRTSNDLQAVLLPEFVDAIEQVEAACGVALIERHDRGHGRYVLTNGATVYYRPYNRIGKARGLTLTSAAIDEVEWSEAEPEEIWTVLTGRLRGKGPYPGLACATSPNGLRGITKKFVDAQRAYADAANRGDAAGMRKFGRFYVVTATSFDNPFLPDHFFEALRSMSKRRYAQEVEGKVLRPLHSVWDLQARHFVPWHWRDNKKWPRVYGIDWGGQGHHVALMWQVQANGVWVLADQLVRDGIPRGRFHDELSRWIADHGDAPPALMGVDRAAPGENQLLQAKFRKTPIMWMDSKDEQLVTTGVELVRDLMDPYDMEPQLLFSDSLEQVSKTETASIVPAMRGYCYHVNAEGIPTSRPKKDGTNDHACDAFRYGVMASRDRPDLHGGRRLWMPHEADRPDQADTPGRSGRQVF